MPSRENGNPIPVLASESFPCSLITGHGDARRLTLELVRRMLLKFAEHEIDECFLVDGYRVFDPHSGEFTVPL